MYLVAVSDLGAVLSEGNGLLPHETMLGRGLLKVAQKVESDQAKSYLFEVTPSGELGQQLVKKSEFEVDDEAWLENQRRFFGHFVAISHQWWRPSPETSGPHPDNVDGLKLKGMYEYLAKHHPDHFVCKNQPLARLARG